MTATADAPTKTATQAPDVAELTLRAGRNVYQRKAAVMRKCKEIKLDKTHPHHHFEYVSIQNLSNHLRDWLVEEGLDLTPTCDPSRPGFINFRLVNVDTPTDAIDSWWPIVEDDKGFAYTVKYPEMRIFQIGDGEEDREMRKQTPAAPRASAGAKECPFCSDMGYLNTRGGVSVYFQPTKGPHAGEWQCNGRVPDPDVERSKWPWANHPLSLSEEEEAAATDAADFDFEKPS